MTRKTETLTFTRETWENIILTAKQSEINSVGNFWTAIQVIEEHLESTK